MKLNKYIGLLLLVLMLLSSFAFSFMGFHSSVQMPTGNIVYQLSQEQEDKLIREGKTIVFFTYTSDCEKCQETMKFLEQVAIGYSDQVFLVKREGNSTSVLVESMNGKEVTGISEERITSLLCELMVNPPSTCVMGKI